MNISKDELMAYVDGELDADRRAAVDSKIGADPEFARQVISQQALRETLRRTFDGVLKEPVPDKLKVAVRGSEALDHRASRFRPGRWRFLAPRWLALAASFVLGILLGQLLPQLASQEPDVVTQGGSPAAGGELARALSGQLSSEQTASDRVRLPLSFVADSGQYCRAFVIGAKEGSVAGIACRERHLWRIHVLSSVAGGLGEDGTYRQAATSLPPLILQAIESSIDGQPLDARAETMARSSNWLR